MHKINHLNKTKMIYFTKKQLIFFLLMLQFICTKELLMGQNSNSDCINIVCTKDAAIGYHDFYTVSSNNYGNAIQNAAYVIPGTLGGLNINRALIEFDLSNVPTNAVITNAKLSLFSTGPIGSSPGHIMPSNSSLIQNILSPWSESQVSWDNQPLSTNANEVILLSSTSPTQDYLEIDITNLARSWQSTFNYGFILKQINETASRGLLFCSSDHQNKEKHPKLEICYTLNTNTVDLKNNSDCLVNLTPNPFFNTINFDPKIPNSEYSSIEFYNLSGLLVKEMHLNNATTTLNVDDLASGIYLAKIKSPNCVINKKIIKN